MNIFLTYQEALNGNIDAQFNLFKHLCLISKPISYSYFDTFYKSETLDVKDFDEILAEIYSFFLKQRENSFYNIENFFKYVYMNRLKKERYKEFERINAKKKEEGEEKSHLIKEKEKQKLEVKEEDSFLEKTLEDELVRHILTNKGIKLTKKERHELSKYLYGAAVSEIAKEEKATYSVVFRRISNALDKVKVYVKNYMPDIKNLY